jgi:hypothetical protein
MWWTIRISGHVKPTTANVQVFWNVIPPLVFFWQTIKILEIMRDKLRRFQMLFPDDGHTFSV